MSGGRDGHFWEGLDGWGRRRASRDSDPAAAANGTRSRINVSRSRTSVVGRRSAEAVR
jgi:hypothetical protein